MAASEIGVRRVPVPARAVARDIEAGGGRAVVLRADLGEPGAAAEAVGAAVAALGSLDVLVNNAAYFARGELDRITLEEVDRTLAVNVRPVFLAAQAARDPVMFLPPLVPTAGRYRLKVIQIW
jgi:3-oxoacyl-[acyl-carrier protein] reductase